MGVVEALNYHYCERCGRHSAKLHSYGQGETREWICSFCWDKQREENQWLRENRGTTKLTGYLDRRIETEKTCPVCLLEFKTAHRQVYCTKICQRKHFNTKAYAAQAYQRRKLRKENY
jgi:rubrerythrin